MAIIVYTGSHGRQYTFTILEKDGKTPRDLTGLTVIWRLKALDDPTVLLSLPCNLVDPPNGAIYVTMDVSLSGTQRDWISQFEVSNGSILLDPSDFIVVNVINSSATSG